MNKLSLLTFRYMKVNMKRTITTCIGVVVSTVLIYMIFSIGYSIYFSVTEDSYRDGNLGIDAMLVCDGKTAQEIVQSAPYYGGADNAAKVKFSYAWAFSVDSDRDGVFYVNDFLAMPRQFTIKKGTLPKNDNTVIIPDWLANMGHFSVGYSFDLNYGLDIDTDESKVVSGTYDADYWLDFDDSIIREYFYDAFFLKGGDKIFEEDNVYVFVAFEDKEDIKGQLNDLKDSYDISKSELSEAALAYVEPETDVGYSAFRAFLLILAFVGIMLSVIMIRNAFNISVHTRSKDYGILRCIGMSRKQIILIILGEALVIGTIGLLFGLVLGHLSAMLIFKIFTKALKLNSYFRLRFIPEAVVLSCIGVFIATLYSMISPIEKLHKLNPVSALHMSDEYENKDKNLKADRGRLLMKLFGTETGYAYKNILRNKKHFLLLVITLTVWTILATAVFTLMHSVKAELYDLYAPKGCDYGGRVEIYDDYEYGLLKSELADIDEVVSVNRMNVVLIRDSEDNIISIGFGFEEKDYNRFVQIADSYEEGPSDMTNVLRVSRDTRHGDYMGYGLYVAGVIEDNDKAFEEFRHYMAYYTDENFATTDNAIIYNIDDNNPDDDYAVVTGYNVLVEFKDNLKHEKFDEFIDKKGYYFDDYYFGYNSTMDGLRVVRTGVIAFLILVFILYMINTINTNISEMIIRKKELNILRTIGMSKKQVDKMLYLEGVIVALIAAIIGNVIGSIFGNVMYSLMLMIDEDYKFRFHIDIGGILFITVMLIIINMFAVWITKPEEEEIEFE